MSDELWKCRIAYEYKEDLPLISLANALEKGKQAMGWLRANDRHYHFVNRYDNGKDGLLFVFHNRDTALLLKLAMQ